jgi:hypothetical protein
MCFFCFDCVMIDFPHNELTWYSEFPDCLVGGKSIVVGQIYAIPVEGCMRYSKSASPGIVAIPCEGEPRLIRGENMGQVCVGPGGIDTCDGPVTVDPGTWGAIKAQYEN